jgi:RNA polymerase sigma-70 factor (ECF subfamily)
MADTFDLDACLRGDKRAWDAFVERYARVIFAAVQRVMRARRRTDPADVEDVAQDVFVRLVRDDYRLLRSYDAGRSSLTTWLTIISRSVAIDHVRRRALPTVPLKEAADAAEPPAPPAAEALDLPEGLLTPRQRLVLRMLFEERMAVSEAAEALGVDAQTIRSTKHKAVSRLRGHFRGAG